MRFQVARLRGVVRGTAEGDRPPLLAEFRIGPELLWSELFPYPRPTTLWNVEAFLWAATLLGLCGYWAQRSARRVIVPAALVVAVLVQLIVPVYFPVAPQSALGWLMLLGGLAAGVAAGQYVTYHPRPTTHDS